MAASTLTPAEKRKQTRLRNKQRLAAAREYRNQLFESMTEKEMADMIEALETIKDDYTSRMEEAEEEIFDSLWHNFQDVLGDYSYDVIKSYVEEDYNGKTSFNTVLDLEVWADEHKTETSFEYQAPVQMAASAGAQNVPVVQPLQIVEPTRDCTICGRPWVGGKCSGGFINHKL